MSIYRIEIQFNGQVSVIDITQSNLQHCMELALTMHRITTEHARTNVQTSLIQDGYCIMKRYDLNDSKQYEIHDREREENEENNPVVKAYLKNY